MTFTKQPPERLVAYESERIITKFALFPITIHYTTKWLTFVTIQQQYQAGGAGDVSFAGWVNKKFIDKGN